MTSSVFWSDLLEDLADPEFLRTYVLESVRITTIDSLVNELDDLREAEGLSKAALARAIGSNPATVRRLFSSADASPTVGTLAEVAAALGMKLVLAPLDDQDRADVTEPLRSGAGDRERIARRGTARRTRPALI